MRENDFPSDLHDLDSLHLEDYQLLQSCCDQKTNVGDSSEKIWNSFSLGHSFPLDLSSMLDDTDFSRRNDVSQFVIHLDNPNVLHTPPHTSVCVTPASFSPSMFDPSRSRSTSPDRNSSRENENESKRRSSHGSIKAKEQKEKVPRHKRPSHINAEHRRRNKIQGNLEELNKMVPVANPPDSATNSHSSLGKKSKAALLSRSAAYCRKLKADNRDIEREADALRTELQSLADQIKIIQAQLPVDGVTKSSSDPMLMEQRFNNYVYENTKKNWKFWIFGLFIRPLFQLYNSTVVTTNPTEFNNSVLRWVKEHCGMLGLRDTITKAMRQVSLRTSAVQSTENLPVEARQCAAIDSGFVVVENSSSSNSSRPGSR